MRLFIFDDQGKNFLMMSVAFFKDQDFTFSLRALFSKIRHNFFKDISVNFFKVAVEGYFLTNMALFIGFVGTLFSRPPLPKINTNPHFRRPH